MPRCYVRHSSEPAAASETPLLIFWVPAERTQIALAVHPDATLAPPIHFPGNRPETEEACAAEILRGWFEFRRSLSRLRTCPRAWRCRARWSIPRWRNLKPKARSCAAASHPGTVRREPEWCHRRLLARIHRLTIGRLRREIEPVTTADFMRFLHRWQHVAPGAQLHGADGVLHVIRQLQGYEISAAAWESEILPSRVAHYSPEFLDQLCLSGEVMWGRLSPHPAFDKMRTAARTACVPRASRR